MASPDDNESAWLMMRALLEDRFKLKMHKEERPLTAWRLVAVKPKMKKADPSERTKTAEGPGADGKDPRTAMPSRSRLVMFQNVTMDQFADRLEGISAYRSTPVINATNLEGSYDFTINFSPVGMAGPLPGGGGGRGGPAGPEAIGPAGPGGLGPVTSDAAEPNGAITLFEDFEQLGIRSVDDLKSRDAQKLYQRMCKLCRTRACLTPTAARSNRRGTRICRAIRETGGTGRGHARTISRANGLLMPRPRQDRENHNE
jgi:uncharacterized protein (TIGR03435 family)